MPDWQVWASGKPNILAEAYIELDIDNLFTAFVQWQVSQPNLKIKIQRKRIRKNLKITNN